MYNNAGYKLDMDAFCVRDKAGKEVAIVYQDRGILMLKTGSTQSAFATTSKTESITPELLHRRMGHLGYRNLEQLAKVANGIKLAKGDYPKCECCSKADLKKQPFGQRRRATRIGEITHLDLVPKITPIGYDGSTGYLSITDDYLVRTRIKLLKSKDEAAMHVKQYNAELETHDQTSMAIIYSDLDGVFTSQDFKTWMATEGITHEPTVHDTPEENGLAEITQFHLHRKATAMLLDAKLPKFLWPLALKHAAYLKERSPAKRLNGKTPYEQRHQRQPDLSHLVVFGSVAYYGSKHAKSEKFASRGSRGRFVGYDSDSTIHIIWIEGTREIRRERNVIIHEDYEPYDGHKHQDQNQDELNFNPSLMPYIRSSTKSTTERGTEEPQQGEYHDSTLQREPDTIQNSTREREQDEMHESNSSDHSADPEIHTANNDCDNRESTRSRTGSIIHIVTPQRPMENPPVNPEEQPNRRSARPSKGQPPDRLRPSFLTASETAGDQEALANVRYSIALTGAPDEHFYTLYTAILDEINHAYQSFCSYLDEAMEQSATIANTTVYEEPGLNDPEPKTFAEAMAGPDSAKWKWATDAEIQQHQKNGTFELVELPPGRTALDGKWVFKIKRDANNKITRYKARFVARGFMQQFGIDYDQTYAGVVRAASVRAIFTLAAFYDHDIVQLDFITAYLNSHINEEIYIKQPEGYIEKGKEHLICKIKKGLYGLKQSAREWSKRLTKFLIEIGFRPLMADHNVFVKGDIQTGLTMTVYVDDVKLIGSDKLAMKQVIEQLSQEFKVTELGDVSFYLGMEVKRDRMRRTVTLSQRAYIEKILDKYGYSKNGRTVKTPMITGQRLEPFDGIATEESKQEFAAQLGSIMYAMVTTRLDIAFAVSSLAQHTKNPGPEHWKALQRIFLYLRSTIDYCITLGGTDNEIKLAGYTDASFAEDSATRRSTGAFIFILNGGPISWTSKRQPTVALSTTEAEYMAMCQAIREASWLRQLLTELGVDQGNEAIKVHADNQSAIALGKNPEFHKRSKHIDVQYHYVQEQVQSGRIITPYLPTARMIADGLTKALSPELHQRLISQCRLDPENRGK
jgi:Reverse transcriptase (RNA-dependent DNA polymerase)